MDNDKPAATVREHLDRSGRAMTSPATLNDIAEAFEFEQQLESPSDGAEPANSPAKPRRATKKATSTR